MSAYQSNIAWIIIFLLIPRLNSYSPPGVTIIHQQIEEFDFVDYHILLESILKVDNLDRLVWSSVVSRIDSRIKIDLKIDNSIDDTSTTCIIIIRSSLPQKLRFAQAYIKVLEKAGEISNAWDCNNDVNIHLKHNNHIYDAISKFDFSNLSRKNVISTIQPIFIVGFFFSGADILENILEDYIKNISMPYKDKLLGLKHNIEIELLKMKESLLNEFRTTHPIDSIASLSNIFKNHNDNFQNINDYLQSNLFSDKDQNDDITYYIHNLGHLPNNYELLIPLHIFFPDSPIIHVVNDPMDTIINCYQKSSTINVTTSLHDFTNIDIDNRSQWMLDLDDILYNYVSYLKFIDFFQKNIPSSLLLQFPYPILHHNDDNTLIFFIQSLLQQILPNITTLPFPSNTKLAKYNPFIATDDHPSPGHWLHYRSQLNDITSLLNHTLLYLKDKGYPLNTLQHLNWMADPTYNYSEYYSILYNTSVNSIFTFNIPTKNEINDFLRQANNSHFLNNKDIINNNKNILESDDNENSTTTFINAVPDSPTTLNDTMKISDDNRTTQYEAVTSTYNTNDTEIGKTKEKTLIFELQDYYNKLSAFKKFRSNIGDHVNELPLKHNNFMV